MSEAKSHREIFRSSALIGGSSVVNVGIGIVRIKLIAVLLGPTGIGLYGIYGSIASLATTVAGCGMSSSGVRQLASSSEDQEVITSVRRALLLAHIVLGCLGMALIWTIREVIAQTVFDGAIRDRDVGWLGLAVFLSLLASSQTTLLQGLRRIGDLARVNIIGTLVGSAVGVAAVYLFGQSGLIWLIIVTPGISILVAAYFAKRLPKISKDANWTETRGQCQSMLRFGFPVMLAGLMNIGTEFLVRSWVARDLGIEAAGHFQASWAISITYLGLVLGAMATDYYPRLTAAFHTPEKARQLVNEQAEMALLIGGPVILAMITLAPLAIYALYSPEFAPAAEILRWQMLGSVVKLIGWPMGFVVLASGRSSLFVFTQFVWNALYLLCLYFLLDRIGLLAIGVGFCFAYMVSVFNVWFVVYKLIGCIPTQFNLSLALVLSILGGVVIYLSSISLLSSVIVGAVITLLVSVFSLRKLDSLVDISGWLRERAR